MTGADECANSFCRHLGVVVFPNSYDCPPCRAETLCRICVSLLVHPNLIPPEIHVCYFRQRPMSQAAMPETAINKNCHTSPNKDNVRATP